MEIIRANGIAFSITKSGYITRHLLKFETEERSASIYSTEYEAISRCLEHYLVFEVETSFENATPRLAEIDAKFHAKVAEHFRR